jgi:hypothetical protein
VTNYTNRAELRPNIVVVTRLRCGDVIRNNRAAWQPGCLQTTRTPDRVILVTSCRPGNYFHLMFIFKLKWTTNESDRICNKWTSVASICHLVKTDLITLESNCNSKNYLVNSRFVPTIDLLTCPPNRWDLLPHSRW